MAEAPEEIALPASLRWLKGLVIALLVCMIGGVITVSAVLVTRLQQGAAPQAELRPLIPAGLALPEGEKISAVTFAESWTLVVSESERLYIFDQSGQLIRETGLRED